MVTPATLFGELKTTKECPIVSEKYPFEYFSIEKSMNCGVCEEPIQGVLWYGPYPHRVHPTCFDLIDIPESKMVNTVNNLYKSFIDEGEKASAYLTGFDAVRAACGGKTIKEYHSSNGEHALTRLFNTKGIEAAKQQAVIKNSRL